MESGSNAVSLYQMYSRRTSNSILISSTRGVRTGKLPEPHQFIINLICKCNLPIYAYVGKSASSVKHTIECDTCGDWFHNECVGFSDRSTIDVLVV